MVRGTWRVVGRANRQMMKLIVLSDRLAVRVRERQLPRMIPRLLAVQ